GVSFSLVSWCFGRGGKLVSRIAGGAETDACFPPPKFVDVALAFFLCPRRLYRRPHFKVKSEREGGKIEMTLAMTARRMGRHACMPLPSRWFAPAPARSFMLMQQVSSL
ncbi:unnamed protein product, partial [Ectocarpus sp. 8 AP-2014]